MKKCNENIVLIVTFLLLHITPVFAESTLGTPDIDDIEYPDDEPHSPEEINLGKTLFFDTRLSLNEKQSCASCHNPDLGFSDGLKTSIGTMGGQVSRNSPHLYNLAWSAALFWDGRSSTLEEQALGPIEAAGEMNLPLSEVVPRLSKVPFYQKQFKVVYGESGLTIENVAKAIAAFERTIISDNAAYDKYIAGNTAAMSPSAIRGLALFKGKANCANCHDGPNFTDDSFHNIGVSPVLLDRGRANISGSEELVGAFKTPGLRNIIFSAPYMHDGSQSSLEDVIDFYNKGGMHKESLSSLIKPLHLNRTEIADLVAFLGALSAPVTIERPKIP
jgi:cytochrome c peroxidase